MDEVFYFFLTNALDGTEVKGPYCSQIFLGDVGEFVSIDGVGYYIRDFVVETIHWGDFMIENF